jgi:hypothetical protein
VNKNNVPVTMVSVAAFINHLGEAASGQAGFVSVV